MKDRSNIHCRPGAGASAGRHLTLAWVLGSLSAFGPLATDMYLPAFQKMAAEFRVGQARIQLTLAVFLLGLAVGQLLWGSWSDRAGRRLPLLAGFGLFVLASAWCAVTTSATLLILARFLMGFGGSAGVVVSRAMVRDLFEAREAARFFSLMMIVGGIAPIVGPFLGNLLLAHGSWRLIFGVLAGAGALCWGIVWCGVPETLSREHRVRGHVFTVLRSYGRVLANRHFMVMTLVLGCMSGVLFSYIASSPFVFMKIHGLPEAYFGLMFAVNGIGFYAGGQANAYLLRRFSEERLLRCGAAFNAAAVVLLVFCAWTGQGGFAAFFGLLFVCLSTLSFIFPNATALAMKPFATEAGSASATLGIFQFVVGAAGGVLTGVWGDESAFPVALQIAVFALVGNLLLWVPAWKRKS